MPISIGSNIASLRTQRALSAASEEQSSVSERLASGMRINKASDDAAGLSIASSLDAFARVFTTAVRNANDAISMVFIADSGLSQLSTLVTRITELAEQSASGTFSNKQRLALDEEAQALGDEYQRIVESTEFNELTLLDGSITKASIQVGKDSQETSQINVEFGQAGIVSVGDGTFTDLGLSVIGVTANDATYGDLDGDGDLDILIAARNAGTEIDGVHTLLNNGDGSFTDLGQQGGSEEPYWVEVGDIDRDGTLDYISRRDNELFVRSGDGDGTFGAITTYASLGVSGAGSRQIVLADINNDSILDVIESRQADHTISYRLGQGAGGFGARSDIGGAFNVRGTALADFNGDGNLDILGGGTSSNMYFLSGNGDGTFDPLQNFVGGSSSDSLQVEAGDFNGDGNMDYARGGQQLRVAYGNGDGTFGAEITVDSNYTFKFKVDDLNGDGYDDIVSTNSGVDVHLGQSSGFSSSQTLLGVMSEGLQIADFTGDGVVDILAAGDSEGFHIFSQGATTRGGLAEFSLRTATEARSGLDAMKSQLDEIASARSTLGAAYSRLETSISNNRVAAENLLAAKSRILDVDVAEAAGSLTRTTILQQVGVAILGQANQLPDIALQLLQV